ncbi:DUF2929 family protein [Gemella sp. GH3]|uniref:DUF2929 family protein n=1 Tax=unclassified Gemella TaxID=2624949 RepID=UPI0015CF9572|nr:MULTISPECIES: DUF2929 family protein [unclassified Gemella]MBF0714399.1 DUF2929 family protein [Gemella sp. GH3.1]NYS51351.1 DUF2929 family protein [Gemella sp. GH3]
MRFVVSLFWGFIFSFIAIFIVKSILGENGSSLTLLNCSIFSLALSFGCVAFDKLATNSKSK